MTIWSIKLKTPLTITELVKQFQSDLKALESLGLEIIQKATKGNFKNIESQGDLSKAIYGEKAHNRNRLALNKMKILKGQKKENSKIGILTDMVNRISKL